MKKKVLKTILNRKCLRICCCCFKNFFKYVVSWVFDDLTIQLFSVFLLNSLIHTSMSFKHLTEDLISVKSSSSEKIILLKLSCKLFIKMENLHLSFFKQLCFSYHTTNQNHVFSFQNTLAKLLPMALFSLRQLKTRQGQIQNNVRFENTRPANPWHALIRSKFSHL